MNLINLYNTIINSTSGNELYQLIKKLYPICRSITGYGVRQTLSIISDLVPIKIVEVPSGTKVFDWTVPDEWNIRDAYIKDGSGNKIIDFKKLNLHVLNYSIPVDKKVSLDELKSHLYTLPEHPEWVPYRTTYYNRNWGFCMAHNQFQNLENDTYHAYIDATLEPGNLTYGECFIQGESVDEILISCHICHPSLTNDNLSGISIATYLVRALQSINTRYSYRFIFIPSTIGSITWASRNQNNLHNIKLGLVLALLGDESNFHYKRTRSGKTLIDKTFEHMLNQTQDNFKILDYAPWGYDERQFNSLGINLPTGRISRKPNSEYPEYHTSAEDLSFVKAEKLHESFNLILQAIKFIEYNRSYINLFPYGEPQLGKRRLYKQIGGQTTQKEYQMALLWILSLSDGNNSLVDIAIQSKIDIDTLIQATEDLLKTGIIEQAETK